MKNLNFQNNLDYDKNIENLYLCSTTLTYPSLPNMKAAGNSVSLFVPSPIMSTNAQSLLKSWSYMKMAAAFVSATVRAFDRNEQPLKTNDLKKYDGI